MKNGHPPFYATPDALTLRGALIHPRRSFRWTEAQMPSRLA